MAKRTEPGAELVYDAAEQWVQQAWRGDGSLFEPDRAVWTTENLSPLGEALARTPAPGTKFMDQLREQLATLTDDQKVLAAELIFVHGMIQTSVGGDTIRGQINEVLGWVQADHRPALSPQLAATLDGGLINPGAAYLTFRDKHLGFLIRVAIAWRTESPSERERLLREPWDFAAWVNSVDDGRTSASQRNALLHLVFPESFDPIVSDDHKRLIVKRFARYVTDPSASTDQQILEVRHALEGRDDGMREYYEPGVAEWWQTDTDAWKVFLQWVGRFTGDARFDGWEREAKLAAADAIRSGLEAWQRGSSDWPAVLKRGIQSHHVGLTNWQDNDTFGKWMIAQPEAADRALQVLLDAEGPLAQRIDQFAEAVPPEALRSSGARLSMASLLLLASEPTAYPFFKPSAVKKAWDLTGFGPPTAGVPVGALYDRYLGFCDLLLDLARDKGINLRDRLDAQSAMWAVARGDPIDTWSPEVAREFKEYRGEDVDDADGGGASMNDGEVPDDAEAQRARYELMRRTWEASGTEPAAFALAREDGGAAGARVGELLRAFASGGELQPLLAELTAAPSISRRPPVRNFLASLGRKVEGMPEVLNRLRTIVPVPASDSDAELAIETLADLIEELGSGGPFTPGSAGLVLASVWTMVAPEKYPVFYQNAEETALTLGWLDGTRSQRHLGYWELVRALEPDDPRQAVEVLAWAWHNFSGLDQTLVARCRKNTEWGIGFAENSKAYLSDDIAADAKRNAEAISAELSLVAGALRKQVAEVLDRGVKATVPKSSYGKGYAFRQESHVSWAPNDTKAVDIRVWVTADGVGIGLWPRWRSTEQVEPVIAAIVDHLPVGFETFNWRRAGGRLFFEPTGRAVAGGGTFIGRWFTSDQALSNPDFGATILEVIAEMAPLIDRVVGVDRERVDTVRGRYEGIDAAIVVTTDGTGHASIRVAAGGGGPRGGSVNRERSAAAERLFGALTALEPAVVDQVRFGPSVTPPQRIDRPCGEPALEGDLLEIFRGGREFRFLVEVADLAVDLDAAQVADRLGLVVEPDIIEDAPVDHILAAAEDLLMDRRHLDDIIELLDEKRQVILYGPPGTGKTYVAQRLAEAIAEGDGARWMLVQFHPSTSYEDFFEGFRPLVVDGQMQYQLQAGPLARIAADAAEDPDHTYVLVIDEINRANLPKVFGELLYLLEYRDRPVRALYRPEDEFRLPENLWFIGTMNTADRSIGLIDAAMRRRFRFVEFFPDREPMSELLPRWLEEYDQPAWVGQLVDMVNEELSSSLSRHLQIGPSFFLSKNLNEATVAKIWRHSIEPFVEDQFFGDEVRIKEFTWHEVWKRFARLSQQTGDGNGATSPRPAMGEVAPASNAEG